MSEPKLFFFVEASSGMGKCQLAEALTIPVVYIPLVGDQLIYQCFEEVSRCISHALLLADEPRLQIHIALGRFEEYFVGISHCWFVGCSS